MRTLFPDTPFITRIAKAEHSKETQVLLFDHTGKSAAFGHVFPSAHGARIRSGSMQLGDPRNKFLSTPAVKRF